MTSWGYRFEGTPGVYLVTSDGREVAMVSILDHPHPALVMDDVVEAFKRYATEEP